MPSKRYAVFGHPIAHSLSPRIHAAFAEQCGIALDYTAIEASAEALPQALAAFADAGGLGANLTLPHKQAGLTLCAALSDRARRAAAVNTLVRQGNAWHGDNTDGIGLVRDLTQRHGLQLEGWRTLLLGAGGAANGVAPALLDAGVDPLVVVNRTGARARALGERLAAPVRVQARGWRDLDRLGSFDLIVDATASAHHAQALALPATLIGPRTLAVSLSYGAAAAAFLAWAHVHGALRALDGLGMLVEQAAESFWLWHGVRPQTEAMYRALAAG